MNGEQHVIIENLSFKYPRSNRYALKNVNLTLKRGEFVVLMGANGAGKTTLCLTFNGIIPKSQPGKMSGRVITAGLDTREASIAQLATKVGIVLQDPETQLFTTKVANEVAFGPENLGLPREEIQERVAWALEAVRLGGCEDRAPTALSGGQKQRLAIAAAISMRPEILVLDEPTSQLDPVGSVEVFSVVKELNEKYNITIFMATHHAEEVAEFADRIVVLNEGELVATGTPKEIFSQSELLEACRIRPPQVASLSSALERKGFRFREFAVTVDDMEKELTCLFGGEPRE